MIFDLPYVKWIITAIMKAQMRNIKDITIILILFGRYNLPEMKGGDLSSIPGKKVPPPYWGIYGSGIQLLAASAS
jgi:hypothetical protein